MRIITVGRRIKVDELLGGQCQQDEYLTLWSVRRLAVGMTRWLASVPEFGLVSSSRFEEAVNATPVLMPATVVGTR